MHLQLKLPYIELFAGRSSSTARFKSYFLYTNFPTSWRENPTGIRGFSVVVFGYYANLCVWQQEGVYSK